MSIYFKKYLVYFLKIVPVLDVDPADIVFYLFTSCLGNIPECWSQKIVRGKRDFISANKQQHE